MNFSLGDAEQWKSILEAMKSMVEEATLGFDAGGLRFRGMDASHVAMIDLVMKKEIFKDYSCAAPMQVRFNLANAIKMLKNVKGIQIDVSYDDESKKLTMALLGAFKRTFKIATLDIGKEEEGPQPKLEPKATVKLVSRNLHQVIENIGSVTDNVIFLADENTFTVKAKSPSTDAVFSAGEGAEPILELTIKEKSESAFNLNYLTSMVKTGMKIGENCVLNIATKMPLKLEYGTENLSLTYYLAPRIEAE